MSAYGPLLSAFVCRLLWVCLSVFCLSISPLAASAQGADQVAAQGVLGPQWKQLSRRAGMVFAGTVLSIGAQGPRIDRVLPTAVSAPPPNQLLSFHVDEAIAGVETGQILTIHEWVGARSMHSPMRVGEHVLIFLYQQSRLGLTSPVGGSLGQVEVDATGKKVSPLASRRLSGATNTGSVSLLQLKRAIRRAREE